MARDISGRHAQDAGGGDKDLGVILTDAALLGEGFGGGVAGRGGPDLERHIPLQRAHQGMHPAQRRAFGDRAGEIVDGRIRPGHRRLSQKDDGRQPLGLPLHHAARIDGRHLAGDADGQGVGRPLGIEAVDDVAECVLAAPQPGVDVGLDAPVAHLLALARLGRQTQHLHDEARRAGVGVSGGMVDPDPHGFRPDTVRGRRRPRRCSRSGSPECIHAGRTGRCPRSWPR